MEEWIIFLDKINDEIDRLYYSGCDLLFFRGHNNERWKLIPSLYRDFPISKETLQLEANIHADFKLNCGPLYNRSLNSWEILFEMRHAGIPTRLLDWTENFGSALYFALRGVDWYKNKKSKRPLKPCVWVMDPYELNEKFLGIEEVYFADDLEFDYDDLFEPNITKMKRKVKIKGPTAILPPRMYQRGFAQKSVYTLHAINYEPIEKICSPCVKKFEIPLNSIDEAYKFLKLSGINEYSLFPDLDGLGRYTIEKFGI